MTKLMMNDVEVTLEECGHCKARPSEECGAAALKKLQENHGSVCLACGIPIKIKSVTVEHRYAPGKTEPFWKASLVWMEGLGIEVQGHQRGRIHEECAARLFGDRLVAGCGYRPWYSESSDFVVEA